jgi:hypothetical protein
MRGMIQILSVLALLVGAPVALLGAVAMLYAKWAPAQPPPSLNEGEHLGFCFGCCCLGDALWSSAMAQAGCRVAMGAPQ